MTRREAFAWVAIGGLGALAGCLVNRGIFLLRFPQRYTPAPIPGGKP